MNLPSRDDELTAHLVRSLQTGRDTEESARRLFVRYATQAARFFQRKGVPPGSIEDLTQETFLRVFHSIGSLRFDHDGSFGAWLLEIERHIFSNWLRTGRTKKREGLTVSLNAEIEGEPGVPSEKYLVDEEPDSLKQLMDREQLTTLRAAIGGLSEQRRRACELRYLHNLKYREIAAVMNISIETVKAHLHQARAVLEDAIQGGDATPKGQMESEDEGRP